MFCYLNSLAGKKTCFMKWMISMLEIRHKYRYETENVVLLKNRSSIFHGAYFVDQF